MKLIRPSEKYLKSYDEAIKENRCFRPNSQALFRDPNSIIEKSMNDELGINLKPGWVPSTTLWLVDKDVFIGEISIRHELTPSLLKYGGHIGYEIRYSESGKGFGTNMLRMALDFCKAELGLRKVLITCDDDNIASAKVIEKNGGVLENKVQNQTDKGEVITRRYWIEIVDKNV